MHAHKTSNARRQIWLAEMIHVSVAAMSYLNNEAATVKAYMYFDAVILSKLLAW